MTGGPSGLPRRHEIDALRSIALALLIGYHVLAAYQPFAKGIEFIPSPGSLEGIWFLGELLNSWRIPVLFLISGLTAGYLLQNRSVRSLLKTRLLRLVPPMVLTFFAIAPISGVLFRDYTEQAFVWIPNPGHLWFVWNLIAYFILSAPLLHHVKKHPDHRLLRFGRAMHPAWWIVFFFVALTLVAWLMEPFARGELFSAHFLRFWSGLTCFLFGVFLVALGEAFWVGIPRILAPSLILFLILYAMRISGFVLLPEPLRLLPRVLESVCGMLAFVSAGSVFFSRPSRAFSVFNRMVFPVYILHMPVQQGLAFFLFPLEGNVWLIFVVHVMGTLVISVLIYGMILRPMSRWHLWFGMPTKPMREGSSSSESGETPPSVPRHRRAGAAMALYVIAPLITLASLALAVYLTVATFGVTEEEIQRFIQKEMEAASGRSASDDPGDSRGKE